jgi:RNA-directed DNA polymerase
MTMRPSVKKDSIPKGITIIEQMVERSNMERAYAKVVSNGGSAGIDNMTVEQLKPYLQKHWTAIKTQLLEGKYKPKAVKQVSIPKPNGGERLLGIPTVLDRLTQQALYQVLNPYFEPVFSEYSYGFREGKNAQQAVRQSKEYQADGKRWVVDMDLAKFFDEVNHDRLIMRIKKKVNDKGLLKLLRKYLKSGIMIEGVTTLREKGTPQGSPLSPLLSNIVLDELDKELQRRGHSFCRYADDCNIYVRSRKAAERVMKSITNFVELKLKLKVNKIKSAVAKTWQRTFLGYSYTWHKQPKIRVPEQTIKRFRSKAKQLFRQGRGRNTANFIKEDLNPLIRGWINYFKHAEVKQFAEDLDGWIRRRLRNIIWRQWKRPGTRYKNLLKLGLEDNRAKQSAYNGHGAWWNSGASHMNECYKKKYFANMGLISMLDIVIANRNH